MRNIDVSSGYSHSQIYTSTCLRKDEKKTNTFFYDLFLFGQHFFLNISIHWYARHIYIKSHKEKEQFFLENFFENAINTNPHRFICILNSLVGSRAFRAHKFNRYARYDNIVRFEMFLFFCIFSKFLSFYLADVIFRISY